MLEFRSLQLARPAGEEQVGGLRDSVLSRIKVFCFCCQASATTRNACGDMTGRKARWYGSCRPCGWEVLSEEENDIDTQARCPARISDSYKRVDIYVV